MARNLYFSDAVRSEQHLYENIIIESLKMYGQDLYYLPRTIVNEIKVLGEDVPSKFNNSYKIEMYIENTEGFGGEGDLFSKFGVEIRDEATFIVSRKRWNSTVSRYDNEITGIRPREGDIIYLPLSNSMFEISHVEHDSPFYQLANLPTYKLRCNLFEYSDEDFDTGVAAIDSVELDFSYNFVLTLSGVTGDYEIGEIVEQTFNSGVTIKGEVTKWTSDTNTLYLAHVGADDGKFHLPITDLNIIGIDTNATGMVVTVSELNNLSENEMNDDFSGDFLDFSESNPFGDIV